jgi:hypothetical protein
MAAALCPSLSQAAAWWNVLPNYGGWPMNLACDRSNSTCVNQNVYASVMSVSALGKYQVTYQGSPTYPGYGRFMYPIEKICYPCNYSFLSSVGIYGAAVSVPAGTAVTIDWACQPSMSAIQSGSTCCGHNWLGQCNRYCGTYYTINYSPLFSAATGSNFSTSGYMMGSTTVYPTTTTTYTLYCSGGTMSQPGGTILGNPASIPPSVLTLTVNATPACGPAISAATGNSNGWVLPKGTTRQFNAGGYNKCLTNNGSYDLFIPGKTQVEINTFFSHPPSGVTIK